MKKLHLTLHASPIMRASLLLLALAASVAVSAQPGGDPIPDPTPPHLYYPLAVGNVWEYANIGTAPLVDGWYTRREITRDTMVDGRRYFIEERSRIDLNWNGWTSFGERIVRYDAVTTRAMYLHASGSEYALTCRFGSDFGAPTDCGTEPTEGLPDGDVFVEGAIDAQIPLGRGPGVAGGGPTDLLAVLSVKTFYFLGIADYTTYAYYAAPVGYAGEVPGFCGGCGRNLSYARLFLDDGVYEVGTLFAVASDDAPSVSRLTLAAAPNPGSGPLTLNVTLPNAVVVMLEAFDALGRRVWAQEMPLGAAAQRVPVDASDWAAGVYVVRARTAREQVSTTVVRR